MRTLVLALCLGIVACRTDKEVADYEAKRKALVAENASKAAAEKAVQDLLNKQLRTSCKDKNVKAPSDSDVIAACQIEAKSLALSPDSVDFPGPYSAPRTVTAKGCSMEYFSYLEAKNAFGTVVRTHFRCNFDPRSETAKITKL